MAVVRGLLVYDRRGGDGRVTDNRNQGAAGGAQRAPGRSGGSGGITRKWLNAIDMRHMLPSPILAPGLAPALQVTVEKLFSVLELLAKAGRGRTRRGPGSRVKMP